VFQVPQPTSSHLLLYLPPHTPQMFPNTSGQRPGVAAPSKLALTARSKAGGDAPVSTGGGRPVNPRVTPLLGDPAPPVLTRPRAGASIINGQPPIIAGAPGSGVGADAEGAADSITLGQMRANMQPAPVAKPKVGPAIHTPVLEYRYQ
jgi:hypothetical protein